MIDLTTGAPDKALQMMKNILQQAASGGIDRERAQALAQRCMDSEELREGSAAQREKSRPGLKGQMSGYVCAVHVNCECNYPA